MTKKIDYMLIRELLFFEQERLKDKRDVSSVKVTENVDREL